jgi:DNA ligase-1
MQTPFGDVVEASRRVGATAGRLEKIALLAELQRRLPPDEVELAVAWLIGEPRQGRTGIGPSALRNAWPDQAAATPELSLSDVDAALDSIVNLRGAGSAAERKRRLRELFARATRSEQEFLARLLMGELRQGALEGVMIDAIARASDIPISEVRRACMLTGDLPSVARAARTGGRAALTSFGLTLFRPVQPMLAQSADDIEEALHALGYAALEYKLDGARVQVHRSGDDVRVFTRQLNDVTASVPELVEAVRQIPARELVLDGEAIALRADGFPLPFQATMRRFGRRLDVAALRAELPLASFYFDCLYIDGDALLDQPAQERFAALDSVVPAGARMPRIVTADAGEAEAFFQRARSAGHEGLVAKALDVPYEAGRRGLGWIKVKPANTLDLVILAAEWGHGRRQGWLSNLHLGARNSEGGGFVMLGKTFKGLTDEMLQWQTRELLAREIARDDWTVHVRPEIVVEIAFNEIQASPRYPGGVALRFARVKRYRPDKNPADADTIDTVRALYARQSGTAG